MERIEYALFILVMIVALFLFGCTSNPGYRIIAEFTATTPSPVTVGNSVTTYPPVLNFPEGSTEMYQLCIQDIARINNVNAST